MSDIEITSATIAPHPDSQEDSHTESTASLPPPTPPAPKRSKAAKKLPVPREEGEEEEEKPVDAEELEMPMFCCAPPPGPSMTELAIVMGATLVIGAAIGAALQSAFSHRTISVVSE